MADQNDQQHPEQSPGSGHDDQSQPEGVPVESEPMEMEAPRRAASAEFVVKSEVGSEAALREAMDPANQSLAEALRLSFRVLQVVIVVLLALFLVSGFETIEEGESGVRLVFKRIASTGPDGAQFLEPGARLNWPYPVGEFYVFEVENRQVNLGRQYWPNVPEGDSFDEYASTQTVTQGLQPGRDGYILTGGGDVAHMRLRATFRIDDPVTFVDRIDQSSRQSNAERIVRVALQRAAVQQAMDMSLQEFVESSWSAEAYEDAILRTAQSLLDDLRTGVRLTGVRVQDTRPAAAIVGVYEELQQAREEAATTVERARNDAEEELIRLAGPGYNTFLDLIQEYEQAVQLEDEDADAQLARIHDHLDGPLVGGEVTSIIREARDYQTRIESTLGTQARRFEGLLAAYRNDPQLVVQERWLRTYANVLNHPDAEILYAPPGGSEVLLRMFRSDHIEKARRDNLLEQQRRQREGEDGGAFERAMMLQRAEEMNFGEPGRLLPGGFRDRERNRDRDRDRNRNR